jgi:voltage-gated potassium channel
MHDNNHGTGRWLKFLYAILFKIRSSFAFKLIVISALLLLTFSVTVYYLESRHVFYKTVDGGVVEDTDRSSNLRSLPDTLWWSIVTSTTVGYGDYYPVSPAGRAVGILLMFFGVSLVGIITGNIASVFVERQLKEGRGMKKLKLRNHFIICGWKRDMDRVLNDIITKNRSFLAGEIVMINSVDQEQMDILKADKRFSDINFIYGDYIDEKVLTRANIQNAVRVLILADRLIEGSVQEVDSHTVMAVLTMKSMNKYVYITAELLDAKFERYLRHSNCDEVILSSNYNRSLIANASTGSGISHVVSELLDVNSNVNMDTVAIPPSYIGKTFDELFTYFKDRKQSILIGVLENTGNFFQRKKEALEEAQKTPDISRLVDNLKHVKGLSANKPVINPGGAYRINDHSRAILIDRSLARAGER